MYGKERKINKQLCGHIGRSHFISFWIQLHHVSKRSRRARVCSWYVRVRMHNFPPPVWNRFLLSSSETFLSPFRATRPKKTGFFMQLHTWTQEYYKGSDEKMDIKSLWMLYLTFWDWFWIEKLSLKIHITCWYTSSSQTGFLARTVLRPLLVSA